MDEFSSGQEIANAMGNMLRSFSEAGYKSTRMPPLEAVPDSRDRFGELVTDSQLQRISGPLFRGSHFARAVEEAFKCLNNAVKEKSGLADRDGSALMQAAFSAHSPILRLNDLESVSDRDEQRGYMDIFAGSMTGIRNPRAHDPELIDEPDVALELLVLANHLMRKLNASTKGEPSAAKK